MRLHHPVILAIIVAACFLLNIRVSAQRISDEELKSAYLFNFPDYVEWPDEGLQDQTFTIGVYGMNAPNDHILSKMAEISNKASNGSLLFQINHFYIGEPISDIDLLYIPEIKRSQQIKLLKRLKYRDILTVGNNLPHFCKDGGIINFLPKEAPEPFQINNKAAKRARLKISPKLLILSKQCSGNE